MSDRLRIIVLFIGFLIFLPTGAPAVVLNGGDILVVDRGVFPTTSIGDGRIIRVNPVTGAQTIVSSGGLLHDPTNIAIDANGDLILSDQTVGGFYGGVVRVEPTTGVQSTIYAGPPFIDPMNLAIEANGDIGVVDPTTDRLYRVDPDSAAVTTITLFPGGQTQTAPSGVALDSNGDFLVTDFVPKSIFRVDPVTGARTTVSSGGLFNTPQGITVDTDGTILVADVSGKAIFRVDPVTGAQTTVSSGGLFDILADIAVEPDGNLVVVDFGSGSLIRVDPVTGAQTMIASGGGAHRWLGLAIVESPDSDGDGVPDTSDNCPGDDNPAQGDNDGDGEGDVCDPDDDNDTIADVDDNCPLDANTLQDDDDFDGLGNACDSSYDAGSVVQHAEDVASTSVVDITIANPPGGNGMIAKLIGNGGVIKAVANAVTAFEAGAIDAASYISLLEDALDKLNAFENQLNAMINNGKIVEPEASNLLGDVSDLRATVEGLIAAAVG